MPIVDAVLLRDRAQPDWITATVREGMGTVPEVVRVVRDAVQAHTWESDWHAGHGRWARQFTVCGLGDEVYLTVMQGLEGHPDIVGYQATSERAPYLFGALRGLPDDVMYRLTRLDVRWDFEGGSSVRLAAVEAMRCIADQHGVTLGTHERIDISIKHGRLSDLKGTLLRLEQPGPEITSHLKNSSRTSVLIGILRRLKPLMRIKHGRKHRHPKLHHVRRKFAHRLAGT